MGGGYYDRDVEYTESNVGYSEVAKMVIKGNTKGHRSLEPTRWEEELLKCEHLNPIVFALDDTSSMGDWPMVTKP